MNKKANVAAMTTILLSLLIGVIMTTIVGTQIQTQTTITSITDDQFTMSNTSCVQVTDNCILSLSAVENATGAVVFGSGNYSTCAVTGSYTQGVLVTGDTTVDAYNGLTLNATYTEEACTAIQGGLTRTIVTYFAVLMAVVMLVYLAGFVK